MNCPRCGARMTWVNTKRGREEYYCSECGKRVYVRTG